jgi:glycerophosphoryl diester phosphodiesterase
VQKTKIIAHRGASIESPENTLASIKKAIDLKVDYIEIDVHLSKDHVPVVIHDDTIDRTTSSKEKLLITDLNLNEIKQLDAGSWYDPSFKGEIIPTLKEVLDLDFKESSLMIEIKKSPYPAHLVAKQILNVIENAKPFKSLILGSFEPDLLHAVHTLNPSMDLIYIVDDVSHINKFQGNRLAIWEKILSQQIIDQLAKNQKEIWTFTIDSQKRVDELNHLAVTGIITNNPRLMKTVLV